ncbi:hypothetical protein [Verrucosispora sioxanthis]|uniref:Uncharacterized protein n=1 Tax=Verrucosispora sioxanthis TaxID=2499994 RepID=A0A6M1L786_9ACTN|nr:hypothetical protein [Verrucosispora sioxanthis]NEE63813.1 hypothetical protein [Verrucosispora sioxanthis]NGM12923.1 hypothetical protein [Verrucosispora sioxanthis]
MSNDHGPVSPPADLPDPKRTDEQGPCQLVTRRYVQRRIAALPAGPEAQEFRRRVLLEIFDELTAQGHPEPLTLLAAVLGIPVDTLVIHLRAAHRPWDRSR